MNFNYEKEVEESIIMILNLANKLKDLSSYLDKRTKIYKNLRELIIHLNEFKCLHIEDCIDTNKKLFDIQIDIELLNDLNTIKKISQKETLYETLYNIIKKFKKSLLNNYLIKINNLKDSNNTNSKLLNSAYEEKFLNEEKIKIVFSIKDYIIEDNEKYLNLSKFYFLENEFDFPMYISENLTFKELNEFYNTK